MILANVGAEICSFEFTFAGVPRENRFSTPTKSIVELIQVKVKEIVIKIQNPAAVATVCGATFIKINAMN